MIAEFFIDIGFKIVEGFLKMLPDFEFSLDSSMWTAAQDILDGVCYFLPLDTVRNILTIIISLAMIRIAISFIRTILSFIPFF